MFPVVCMDCGSVTGESEIEGSTGLCGVCPRSRERLGLVVEHGDVGELDEEDGLRASAVAERALQRERAEDFDPVAEDLDD